MDSYLIMTKVKEQLNNFFITLGNKLDGREVTIKKDTRWIRISLDDKTDLIINWLQVLVEEGKSLVKNPHEISNIWEVLDIILQSHDGEKQD